MTRNSRIYYTYLYDILVYAAIHRYYVKKSANVSALN